MTTTQAISTGLRNYATFSGRSSKREFWVFFGFVIIGHLLCQVLDAIFFGGGTARFDASPRFPISTIFTAATYIPFVAVAWRRRHDTGKPGWPVVVPFALMTLAAFLFFLGFSGAEPIAAGATDEQFVSEGVGYPGSIFGALVITLAIAVGLFILWLAQDGETGTNPYGPPPEAQR